VPNDQATALETFGNTALEIDRQGNCTVDTQDASEGDVTIRLARGRSISISIGDQPVFEISQTGGALSIDIGGGASEPLVLGNALKELLNSFFMKYDTHVHPTPMGPSGPPVVPSGAMVTAAQLSAVATTK
jgi:hypothetical protein